MSEPNPRSGQVVQGFDRTFGQPTAVTWYDEAPELFIKGLGGDEVFWIVTSDRSPFLSHLFS